MVSEHAYILESHGQVEELTNAYNPALEGLIKFIQDTFMSAAIKKFPGECKIEPSLWTSLPKFQIISTI